MSALVDWLWVVQWTQLKSISLSSSAAPKTKFKKNVVCERISKKLILIQSLLNLDMILWQLFLGKMIWLFLHYLAVIFEVLKLGFCLYNFFIPLGWQLWFLSFHSIYTMKFLYLYEYLTCFCFCIVIMMFCKHGTLQHT